MKIKNVSGFLIWATSIISMFRYAGAFVASDVGIIQGVASNVFTILFGLTGLAMGFLDSIGTALLFNGWRKVMPSAGVRWGFKFKMLTVFVVGLFISTLIILVPFTLSRIEQVSISVILGGKGSIGEWVWGTMVNLIPFLLIGGVTIGNKWISEIEMETSETSSRTTSGSSRSSVSSSGTSFRTGRPSTHQERVFSYLEKKQLELGVVPSFSDVMKDLNLPQSTASRLRNEWLNRKR